MVRKKIIKTISLTMALIMATAISFNPNVKAETVNNAVEQKTDLSKVLPNRNTIRYIEYFNKYSKNGFNNDVITINPSDYSDGVNVQKDSNFKGKNAITTTEQGYVTWNVNVEKSGLYAVDLEYYPMEGTGGSIERTIFIDNKLPFQEAFGADFTRIYKDAEENPSGKAIRPNQVEAPRWNEVCVNDPFGYFGDAMYFYLEKGQHTLTFNSVKEPMAISKIQLVSKDLSPKNYDEVLKGYNSKGAKDVKGVLKDGIQIVQAENAFEKGDPTLVPKSDSTSTKTQPYVAGEKLLNVIGGLTWEYSKQWISWKINVPESGFYNIGVRSLQDKVRDIYCNRTLYIDDKVPFKEAENVHFSYDDKWKTSLIGNDNPYKFYLEKGEHTLKLKNTAGDLEEILTEADSIVTDLNKINLDLVALMSIKPDTDRDYQIAKYMPESITSLKQNSERLKKIHDIMVQKTGKTDSLTSQLEQLIDLTSDMANKPEKIAALFDQYRSNVGSFGNWITKVRQHPLTLDYLFVSEVGTKVANKNDNFFDKAYSVAVAFVKSFTKDYSMLSQTDKSKKAVTVWIGSGLTGGRDQAIALNQMVNDSFTSKTGIPVNLQLVPENVVLTSTLAGRGPDVALQSKATDPVDFAVRGAACDLTKFKGYDEVSKRFFNGAITPFKFNGGVYALPETLHFPMMFYRIDILQDLGINPESLKTWDDIAKILPVLQAKNMNFGLPQTQETYSMFLYQMGGSYYTEKGDASNLNSQTALDAFKYWTDFYSVYSLPIDFSLDNRLRTGEIPIGIGDYITNYNNLTISAPEIKGKWAMVPLPGIKDANGKINNTSPTSSLGCMLMSSSKNKEEAWEFMKWWTSADSQYGFGKQLEAAMGASARYNTANVDALQKMSWAGADRRALMEQAKNQEGVPQVPGGYFTERYITFAKLDVLTKKAEPRETLSNYSENITEEIKFKRNEFNLR